MGVSLEAFRCRIGLFNLCNSNVRLSTSARQDSSGFSLSFRLVPAATLCCLLLIAAIELNPGPDSFTCKYCSMTLESASKYCKHLNIHKNRKNFSIQCCFCPRRLKSANSFQYHVSMFHHKKREQLKSKPMSVRCSVKTCKLLLTSRKEYMLHMKKHILKKEFFKCPICKKNLLFKTVQNFRVHTSLYHPTELGTADEIPANVHRVSEVISANSSWEVSDINDQDEINLEMNEESLIDDHQDDATSAGATQDSYPNHVIVDELARFYLKLEGESVLPTSTVQEIATETKLMTELSHDRLKSTLNRELQSIGLDENVIKSVISTTFKSDVVFNVHHKGEDAVHLGTDHLRVKYWRRKYPYVEPKEIPLGDGKVGHYLSIRETIKLQMKDSAIKAMVKKSWLPVDKPDPTVFTDFRDGSLFSDHKRQHPNGKCFQIHLFQDAFEFCPFGPAAGVYKPIGFYYSLGNIDPEYRNKLDLIHLVYLVLDKSLQPTQQEELDDRDLLKEGVAHLIAELEDLKINGIDVDGEVIPVCLLFMIGDSLGQHQMGCFVRSFSSEYFCRLCPITRSEFKARPDAIKKLRTPESYDADCNSAKKMWLAERSKALETARKKKIAEEKKEAEEVASGIPSPRRKAVKKRLISKHAFNKLKSIHCRGVKYRKSPFNSEKLNFHVCTPAMPVCLGHDILEGSLKCILAHALKYFIEEKKWFDLETLNRRIKAFKCKGSDARDAPTPLKNLNELSGHAVENWNLLRLLPFIIGDLIEDPEDEMWQLVLALKEITEYVCAPKISASQIHYLKLIIKQFLVSVKKLEKYLEGCIIPKLHFLRHYPDLIFLFGPLIRLATLKYESRHVFFKRVVRACKSFKNVTFTMARKYMCRFAYDHSSEIIPPDVQYDPKHSSKINLRTLSEQQVSALPIDLDVENTELLESIIIKGIEYKNGSYLVLDADGEVDLAVGCINMILLTPSNSVSFILQRKKATNSFQGYYSVSKPVHCDSSEVFIEKSLDDLPDYYPLPSYDFGGTECLTLKHSVICMN